MSRRAARAGACSVGSRGEARGGRRTRKRAELVSAVSCALRFARGAEGPRERVELVSRRAACAWAWSIGGGKRRGPAWCTPVAEAARGDRFARAVDQWWELRGAGWVPLSITGGSCAGPAPFGVRVCRCVPGVGDVWARRGQVRRAGRCPPADGAAHGRSGRARMPLPVGPGTAGAGRSKPAASQRARSRRPHKSESPLRARFAQHRPGRRARPTRRAFRHSRISM